MENKGRDYPLAIKNFITKHFSVNPFTGVITRDDRKGSKGHLDKDGYLILKVKQIAIKAHRLAWFLYYGYFPTKEIDHINRNRTDNRKCNLRQVNRSENIRNTTKIPNAKTGVIGVYYDATTRGLKRNYTTRVKRKTFRFRTLKEAVDFRKSNNLEI